MKRVGNILRDYQEDIRRCVLDAWEHGISVLVQMPTGTGKTIVLASLVNEQLKINNGKPGCLVWIIAHRRELVEQIEELAGETEAELVRIRTELIAELKSKTGYSYSL